MIAISALMISLHSTHYKIISYPPGEDVIIKYLTSLSVELSSGTDRAGLSLYLQEGSGASVQTGIRKVFFLTVPTGTKFTWYSSRGSELNRSVHQSCIDTDE